MRNRLGSTSYQLVKRPNATMRIRPAVQVTTWFGKIFTSRRRMNRRYGSPGRATQVSTKPLSMKKRPSTASAMPASTRMIAMLMLSASTNARATWPRNTVNCRMPRIPTSVLS
jgi:hypothetical protein